MYPGIRKYLWLQKKANYFGHLDPSHITKAIIEAQSKRDSKNVPEDSLLER
jgi:hypothetical protein